MVGTSQQDRAIWAYSFVSFGEAEYEDAFFAAFFLELLIGERAFDMKMYQSNGFSHGDKCLIAKGLFQFGCQSLGFTCVETL